jgi:hypothetical protein
MELPVMKKILLVLAMIAASVFLAQPAVAAEGDPVTTEVADTAASTEAPAEQAPAEEVVAAPEVQAPEDPPPAALAVQAPADNAGSDKSSDKPKGPKDEPAEDEGDAVVNNAAPAANDNAWVCKYKGTPGVDEELKDGKNPIQVSTDTPVGGYFNDGQGRSYVLQLGGPEPSVTLCPPPNAPAEVATEAPSTTPATCTADGTLVLPTTVGVVYTPTPAYTGDPGTYDVVATPASAAYVLTGTTVWNDLVVGEQLSGQELCPVIVDDEPKVFVCKFVQKPNSTEYEHHVISVAISALDGKPALADIVLFVTKFEDNHAGSVVVAFDDGDTPKPDDSICVPAVEPTVVTPEAPKADPATCEVDGMLILPETEGVVYNSVPGGTGPGDYVVTATPASAEFVLTGDTVFEITVDAQLPLDECVKDEELNDDEGDEGDEGEVADEALLPDTGGLPLWVLLLAGPLTAAGLLVLTRRRPVNHTFTSGRGGRS